MANPTQTTHYYVRRKPSGYLGNAPVFWAIGGGYTSYVEKAERMPADKAEYLVSEDPEKWEIYPCQHLEERCHLVFDMQDTHRLGVPIKEDLGTGPYATRAPSSNALGEAIDTAKLSKSIADEIAKFGHFRPDKSARMGAEFIIYDALEKAFATLQVGGNTK